MGSLTRELVDIRAAWAGMARVRAATRGMRVTVRSPDRSVTVTVDGSGQLCGLTIEPSVTSALSAQRLAQLILRVAHLGAAQVREQVRVATRDALPDRLRHLVGTDGSVDLATLFSDGPPDRPM